MEGVQGRIGNTGEQGKLPNYCQTFLSIKLKYWIIIKIGAPGNVGPRGPPGNPGQCPVDCWQAMNQANALYYSRAQGNQKGP